MQRIAWSWTGGAICGALGIVIAKAQIDPQGYWGWVLTSPHVVPSLFLAMALLVLIGLAQWEWARRLYWRIFAWVIPAPKEWIGKNSEITLPVSNGLQIISAVYRCVQDGAFFNTVTERIQLMVKNGRTVTVEPTNRVFGDPCDRHDPYIKGHHKNLEVTYVFRGTKLLTEYDPPYTLTITEKWVKSLPSSGAAQ